MNICGGLGEGCFRNGFDKGEKYSSVMERIRKKCDERRVEITEEENKMERDEEDKVGKKVKL